MKLNIEKLGWNLLLGSVLAISVAGVANVGIESALNELKAEPKIKSVADDGYATYVGVFDDGSSRDGYAMYVCEVLKDNGVSGYRLIRVLDVVKAARENETVELGRFRCNK